MPKGTIRVLVTLSFAILGVAAAAKPPLPEDARLVAVALMAAVAALSARSSLLLVAARKHALVVTAAENAPRHRLLLATIPAAVVAALLAVPVTIFGAKHARFEVLVAGVVGALVGTVLASIGDKRAKRARPTTTWTWLLLDTALPAGVVAACFGVCLAFLRLHAKDAVEPGELARHLGATAFCYAALLGVGGYFKAFGELSAGLVVVDHVPDASKIPSPVVVGGVLGLAILLAWPRIGVALDLDSVLAIKAAGGLLVGGGCSLLGAIRGAHAALEKRAPATSTDPMPPATSTSTDPVS